MENTILVPVDFSEQSYTALKQACNLAQISNFSITLLNVIKEGSSLWRIFSDSEKLDFELKIEKKLKEIIKKHTEEYKIEIGSILRKGKVVDEIIRVSDYLKPKLLLMGSTSGTYITRKIIGSRTLHIIKTLDFPVISIKGQQNILQCRNILLPIDGTKETTQKVDLAILMAKIFNSEISLLSIVPLNNKVQKDAIIFKLNNICQRLKEEGIISKKEIIDSSSDNDKMASVIIDYAHTIKADLIIILTQSEDNLINFFLGSLAQNIIFSSDIPVLSSKPKLINS